jgi:hypothetical protein
MASRITCVRVSSAFPCLFAAVLALPASLVAQEPSARSVVLAVPDSFPEVDARAIVVRERGRDVILFKTADMTPETLDVALRLLARLDRRRPWRGQGLVVPITGYVPGGPLRPERRSELGAAIRNLQRRPVVQVGSLGPGRWLAYRGR